MATVTARMEKAREALKLLPPQPGVFGQINDAIIAAALAEVEEWEANRRLMAGRITGCRARAEAAEAERDRWRAVACNVKEEKARADALHAALEMLWTYYLLPISDEQKAQVVAALAPADRDTP